MGATLGASAASGEHGECVKEWPILKPLSLAEVSAAGGALWVSAGV